MKKVFADTLHWVAVVGPHDPWHGSALQALTALGPVQIITTEEVLVEFLSSYSGRGVHLRQTAILSVQAMLRNSLIDVIPQSHESFVRGLQRYANRPDKGYSLVDCISMNTMLELGITEVLTHDHHFTQEGFTVLIQ